MIAFAVKTKARMNDPNDGFGQGKLSDSSNILELENLFPVNFTKTSKSVDLVYPFLAVILFYAQ